MPNQCPCELSGNNTMSARFRGTMHIFAFYNVHTAKRDLWEQSGLYVQPCKMLSECGIGSPLFPTCALSDSFSLFYYKLTYTHLISSHLIREYFPEGRCLISGPPHRFYLLFLCCNLNLNWLIVSQRAYALCECVFVPMFDSKRKSFNLLITRMSEAF